VANAASGGDDAIGVEYRAVWQRLVDTHVDVGDSATRVERSDDLARAWQLMGAAVASTLVRHPEASPADVVAALEALNPENPVATCDSNEDFGADIRKLATPAAAATLAGLMTDSPYGFVNGLRISRAPGRSTLALWRGPPDVVLTPTPRRGRLYVVDARRTEDADMPPLTGGNTATSSPSPSR
jgi:hypothetical protein